MILTKLQYIHKLYQKFILTSKKIHFLWAEGNFAMKSMVFYIIRVF